MMITPNSDSTSAARLKIVEEHVRFENAHDLDGIADVNDASAAAKTSLIVTLKAGKLAYKCTVPGHAAAGMKGKLTVR